MNIVNNKLEHILPTGFLCAEVPYWVKEEAAVYFVDTENPRIAKYTLATEDLEVFNVPYNFQCIAKCENGNWIGTVTNGVVIWNQEKNTVRFLGNPEKGKGTFFLNDGTVDKQGRFFFGSYDLEDLEGGTGSIYMVDHDLSIRQIATGFSVCNGMVFSSNNKKFYMSEQFGGRVLEFDWNEDDCELSNQKSLYDIPKKKGLPDGLIMDSEGMLWVAHWWGWQLSRLSPEGELLAEISVPVTTPTCMAFVGEKMDQLFITSAIKAVGEEDLMKGHLAGDIFQIKLETTGREENRFKY
ncbi:MAG: SMP-30/gluconolactonase/LRE family protein [Spirochaetales bacterium]|uniref:SMP-30/gluconolactonase/LRE family protein n=1 Tax=Candidatus Thalassospirochaeta sargassi TaxID=3119039 RepID=A0AAJ1IF76_9SPIO|nr:SMP-30/gluconolactonase/LRE family protein [Spirochaetales bacterium]